MGAGKRALRFLLCQFVGQLRSNVVAAVALHMSIGVLSDYEGSPKTQSIGLEYERMAGWVDVRFQPQPVLAKPSADSENTALCLAALTLMSHLQLRNVDGMREFKRAASLLAMSLFHQDPVFTNQTANLVPELDSGGEMQ